MAIPREEDLRVLVLEPYYGGSHKSFLSSLSQLPFLQFELMTFPARKWKWRMRLAAPFYARKLIVVSTAWHEFFGISVIEAVRAGCRALLPRRLSYPELFPKEFLYDEGDFTSRLRKE